MIRIILGVVVGFIAWSILWLGGDAVLSMLSPGWYGAERDAAVLAAANNAPYQLGSGVLLLLLVLSVIASIVAGFLAAAIANESARTTLILGVLLLIVGIAVQAGAWSMMPVWYHIIFLVLLLPMTMLGGKLRPSAAING